MLIWAAKGGDLAHVIISKGVSINPSKGGVMVKWPRPKFVKALRGFLCLFGYYRKYVANYGHI